MILEKICEELGIEVGEEWDSIDGNSYCILNNGLIEVNGESSGYKYWEDIFTGLVKPVWKPKYGEEYQTPQLGSHLKFASKIWYDHESDYVLLRRGLVFKTSNEALAAADKMLESLKE